MNRILAFILLIFLILPAEGQQNYQQRLYTAFVDGEMYLWKTVIYEMEAEYGYSRDRDLLYELCFAYYGYTGYLMEKDEKIMARQFLDRGLARSRELEQGCSDCWDVYALRGALFGLSIALDRYKSAFIGPKAMRYIRQAHHKSPSCFNCNLEMGNFLFNAPLIVGGSKINAIPYYIKALEILDKGQHKKERHWIYMNSVLALANAYRETGQVAKARTLYNDLLEYEPRAEWIRIEMMEL